MGIALTIYVTKVCRRMDDVRRLIADYVGDGGTVIRGEPAGYPFDHAGESDLTQKQYTDLDSLNTLVEEGSVRFEGGLFYHIFTEAEKDNLVPVDWPHSKDGEGVRISFENYFQKHTQYLLDDGTWLFRVTRENVGLTDADRKIYQADLGTLLVKSEGLGKLPIKEGI